MKQHYFISFCTVLLVSWAFSSCSKSKFLDAKPSSSLVVPSTLSDFQALLDQTDAYDGSIMNVTPALGELSTDEYYLTYSFWNSLSTPVYQNCYIWAPDIYQGETNIDDWNTPYEAIFYCNVVLDGLTGFSVSSDQQQDYNSIKGSALFMRAFNFFNLATIFAPMLDSSTYTSDLGIPLRLTSSIDVPSTRATVQQTYDQIISDIDQAIPLLPSPINYTYRNRPSLPAAYALLARVYLSIRNYDKASLYADSCLQLYNTLINYNTVSFNSSYIEFSRLNNETIWQNSFDQASTVIQQLDYSPGVSIDTNLSNLYKANDTRQSLFFYLYQPDVINLNGLYNGTFLPFTGLAIDETYLIRAECNARAGDISDAANDLNTLWQNRLTTGSYMPVQPTIAQDSLMSLILLERRKELIFRGVRWTDLRRLNKEGANITVTRVLNGQTYTLPPNSPLYVLPIPPDVITLSGIQQNQR
jgi:starch-binding outer membrane protein, SusD/RagB family